MARRFERLTIVSVIVNFPVIDDVYGVVFIRNRLAAATNVDD